MKTKSATVASALVLLFLLTGLQAAHAYYTTDPPQVTPSTISNVSVAEFTISSYGSEYNDISSVDYDNLFGYLQSDFICTFIGSNGCSGYMEQPAVGYDGSDFVFAPQIWSYAWNCVNCSELWDSTAQTLYGMSTPSDLPDYIIVTATNAGSSNETYSVTSCNQSITVDAGSMYAAVIYEPSCTLEAHADVDIPTTYDGTFNYVQYGLVGTDSGEAVFSSTVAGAEAFTSYCVNSGCTYSYSTANYIAESSNLRYYTSDNSYHDYECQETSGESSC